jgi:3D (Asp-Asp-Asp) domain-containing protein
MDSVKANVTRKKDNYSKSKLTQLVLFVVFLNIVLLPYSGITVNNSDKTTFKEKLVNINKSFAVLAKEDELELEVMESEIKILEEKPEVAWSKRYTMTAYNSEVAQCDASPCITANGFNVCEHGIEDTVAANFLKFGTKLRIPELFGDKVFTVRDRMNSRYTERVDVWLLHKDNAIDFGVKYPLIEVLK